MKAVKVTVTLISSSTAIIPMMVTLVLIRFNIGPNTPFETVCVFVIIPFITSLLFRLT